MGNAITTNKNLVRQDYNTAGGTLPASAVTTTDLTPGTIYTTWDRPENYNAAALDLILGGVAAIPVGSLTGTNALTAANYQPMAMRFTGTLTDNLIFTLPSGVGGTWIVKNETTGSYTITISSLTSGASATVVIPQDGIAYVVACVAVSGSGVYLNGIADGSITTAKIATGAVTTAKLADGAVTTDKLGDYSITNTKFLPSAIDGLAAKTTLASADEFSIYDSAAVLPISGITVSGAGPTYTATATTSSAHGLTTGNSLTISGATGNTSVNGVFTITVTSTTQFTYTVTSGAAVTGSPVYILNPGLKKITYANVATTMATSLVNTFAPMPGYLFGLVISNNALDTVNDIDVSAGSAADNTTLVKINVSAITKRLDANWAPGSGNGGRYSGAAIANTTYHVWAVAQTDGTGGDIYLDPSANRTTVLSHIQAEPGGSLYTNARRIGSIIRASGSIVQFYQYGNDFYLANRDTTYNNNAPSTSAQTLALMVPTGIKVCANIVSGYQRTNGSGTYYMVVTPLTETDTAPSSSFYTNLALIDTNRGGTATQLNIMTDTSGQIRYRANTTAVTVAIWTVGWADDRGQTS